MDPSNSPSGSIALSEDQVRQILDKYNIKSNNISKIVELRNGHTSPSDTKTYQVALISTTNAESDEHEVHFLTVSLPVDHKPDSDSYHPNALPTVDHLISLLRNQSSIPVPPHVIDTTQTIIPYHYLLLSPSSKRIISLSQARKENLLNAQDDARIDLQLGAYLAQLHAIQNDWFGVPLRVEPSEPSYSWQETFTLLLETLLHEAQSNSGEDLPYEDIRRYLSRAIGFFLFDDIEVPSLIWSLGGSADDIFITVAEKTIEAVLPTFTRAVWGDPLLESFFFLQPGPSEALMEGYLGAGGEPMVLFPRQKTKRVWYRLFLALVLLLEEGEDEKELAREMVIKCVEDLKDAPCY